MNTLGKKLNHIIGPQLLRFWYNGAMFHANKASDLFELFRSGRLVVRR